MGCVFSQEDERRRRARPTKPKASALPRPPAKPVSPPPTKSSSPPPLITPTSATIDPTRHRKSSNFAANNSKEEDIHFRRQHFDRNSVLRHSKKRTRKAQSPLANKSGEEDNKDKIENKENNDNKNQTNRKRGQTAAEIIARETEATLRAREEKNTIITSNEKHVTNVTIGYDMNNDKHRNTRAISPGARSTSRERLRQHNSPEKILTWTPGPTSGSLSGSPESPVAKPEIIPSDECGRLI